MVNFDFVTFTLQYVTLKGKKKVYPRNNMLFKNLPGTQKIPKDLLKLPFTKKVK
jgi:hypothetical protein